MSSSDESQSSGSEVEEEVKKKPVAKKKRAAKEPKTKKETKKPKKTKKKKDPNAPKRPLSAFMFYSQKTRPIVKQENPDATFAEVAKILGEQWKALDEKAKKEFEQQHATDKARFEKEKANYEKSSKKKKADSDDEEDESDD